VDVIFTFQDPSTIPLKEQQTLLGSTCLSSGENCVIIAHIIDFDFAGFRDRCPSLNCPFAKTEILTEPDDPNMSVVLVFEPAEHGLPVLEISSVAFQGERSKAG
jgi:hypothetical protein